MTNSQNNRGGSITGNILIFLAGLAVVMSELPKIAGVPAVVNKMAAAGFSSGKITLIGALGFSCAVLFLYSRTRSIGVLLLSSFLGGAVCLHVQRSEYAQAIVPATLLALAWIGTFLRYPAALWSFRAGSTAQTGQAEKREARLASREA